MFNYATKSDLKSATDTNTSKFAKKVDLASLKSDVDIDKLETTPIDFSKPSNVVKNVVAKKTIYRLLLLVI